VCGTGSAILQELQIVPARIFLPAVIGSFDIARACTHARPKRYRYCCSFIERSFLEVVREKKKSAEAKT
jgi:hypothetical protein